MLSTISDHLLVIEFQLAAVIFLLTIIAVRVGRK
jgi:hypothetical protein